MPIDATCEQCDATFHLSRSLAGKLVRCANCGFSIRVPDASPINTLAALTRGAAPLPPAPPPKKRAARAAIVSRIPDDPVPAPQPAPAPVQAAAPPPPPPPPAAKPAVRPADADDDGDILELDIAPTPRKAPPPPEPDPEPEAPVRAVLALPAKPTRPAPSREPDPDAGDYDLSALAAAERNAEPLEERVYIPPEIIRPARPSFFERFRRDPAQPSRPARRTPARERPDHDLSLDSLFVQSPMFYGQLVAAGLTLAASQTLAIPILRVAAIYLGLIYLVTLFTVYFKILMGCSKKVRLLTIPGFIGPFYIVFQAMVNATHHVDPLTQHVQNPVPSIIGVSMLLPATAVIYTLCTDPLSLVRAFIAIGYFLLDYTLIFYLAAAVQAYVAKLHAS